MDVSFTFVTVLSTIVVNYGYPTVIGAVFVGGIFEETLGLLAKYWRKIIAPIVAASVVTAIGFSLFTIGARSFGGGYAYAISSLFGCPPVTSFSQNVDLVAMTKFVNCFTIMTGAACMILTGLLPPIGNFFASLHESVLGGCIIMMFGTILTSGMKMVAKAGFTQRNITIAALSLSIGIGFTTVSQIGLGRIFPDMVQNVFAKKSKSINLEGGMYTAEVESFTHKNKNQVIVAKKFLNENDHVLLIDDFLANGCALQGLIQIVQSSGATVEGIGIAIEKGFQSGGIIIQNLGYQLESLAIVEKMNWETGENKFREQ